ncbi:hypothetical protein L7F22_008731 [Adiantum nelumboides]|nr:hypothetical protein [Adiantum nelumboides]
MGDKIVSSPKSFCDGALDVVRLESTKLLLDPLVQLKKADAKLNFSQGALDEVVGEELSVLPGMDALLALGAMESLIGFARDISKGRKADQTYDVVVYDGLSSEETLRLLGAAEKSRWYLQRARDLAEKTDTGRVTSPSILRLLETSATQDSGSDTSGRSIAELWDGADKILERISQAFADSKKFSCFLVMDPANELSVNAAMRYWGCATQAGARVTGAFYAGDGMHNEQLQAHREKFAPLAVASLPLVPLTKGTSWSEAISNLSANAKGLLQKDNLGDIPIPVDYNIKEKTVTFFLPGFDKSEIKLSQWRGGSALLIEVGDQRRVVQLPPILKGKDFWLETAELVSFIVQDRLLLSGSGSGLVTGYWTGYWLISVTGLSSDSADLVSFRTGSDSTDLVTG